MQELSLKNDFTQEKLNAKEGELAIAKNEIERQREEIVSLKAAVKEGNKTRETLAQQMAQAMKQEIKLKTLEAVSPTSSYQQ